MRSQFLTLLCVLTFLSCGWGLFDSAVSFWRTDAISQTPYIKRTLTPEQQKQQPTEYFEDRSSGDAPMPGDPEEIRSLAIAQFVYSLLTLIGAILMFQLRRIGFWIYLLGVLTGLILPFILAGSDAFLHTFGVFFSIIFAVLYGFNLRDMR